MGKNVKRPEALGELGSRLWDETLAVYDMGEHELRVLGEACHTLDLIQQMRRRIKRDGVMVKGSMGQPVAHPLASEVRQQRALFSTLMRSLDLPDVETVASPVEGEVGLRAVSDVNQHRAAAQSRWAKSYGS